MALDFGAILDLLLNIKEMSKPETFLWDFIKTYNVCLLLGLVLNRFYGFLSYKDVIFQQA